MWNVKEMGKVFIHLELQPQIKRFEEILREGGREGGKGEKKTSKKFLNIISK
jgi:hypothetical protein